MATGGLNSLLEDELSCSICLQLYTDPVLLGCQHTFCRQCILQTWHAGGCTCPECRKIFYFHTREDMRLKLEKNLKLASIVDKLYTLGVGEQKLSQGSSQAFKAEKSAGVQKGDCKTCCDFCDGMKTPAIQTCQTCNMSMCEDHLQPHLVNTDLRQHLLVSPVKGNVNIRKCAKHGQPITEFCLEDHMALCVWCKDQKHQRHRISSIKEVASSGKAALLNQIQNLTSSKASVHRRLDILRKTEENVKRTSLAFYASVDAAFDAAVASLREEKESMKQSAGAEENAVLEKIHAQITAQEMNLAAAEAISREGCDLVENFDALHFLEVRGDIEKRIIVAMKNPPNENIVTKDLFYSLRDVVQHLPPTISNWKIENTMLKNFRIPILDEDTVHYQLEVDTTGKELSLVQPLKRRCDVMESDDAFTYWRQALCEDGYNSGLHYWEVDINESREWSVGVCYGSMVRKGKGAYAKLGDNCNSWCLEYTEDDDLIAIHDGEENIININGGGYHIDRVGVLLDFSQQCISFYDVLPARVHLHTFQAAFIASLFPAFRVMEGTIAICTNLLSCARLR